jgi:hypothetical protein
VHDDGERGRGGGDHESGRTDEQRRDEPERGDAAQRTDDGTDAAGRARHRGESDQTA